MIFALQQLVEAGSGDPIYRQHVMWLLGQPEIYLFLARLVLVAIGIIWISRRLISARQWGVFAAALIGVCGFVVWHVRAFQHAQQSYTQGVYPEFWSRLPFYISSGLAIGVLLALIVVRWLALRANTIAALFLTAGTAFLIAGLVTAYLLSSAGADQGLHDTYYVRALVQALGVWAALYLVFTLSYLGFRRIIGVEYNRWLGGIHWLCWVAGTSFLFFPQHLIGGQSMPRRYSDMSKVADHLEVWAQLGVILLGVSLLVFAVLIAEGVYRRIRNGGSGTGGNLIPESA